MKCVFRFGIYTKGKFKHRFPVMTDYDSGGIAYFKHISTFSIDIRLR